MQGSYSSRVKLSLLDLKPSACCVLNEMAALSKHMSLNDDYSANRLAKLQTMKKSAVAGKQCCKAAYLRGVFISCGSISDPGRNTRLDLSFPNEEDALKTAELSKELSLNLAPKVTKRNDFHIVYFKNGESIGGFLGAIGAHSAMLAFENLRVRKDVNNNINRRVNCENANMEKTISAAVNQINDITFIQREIGLDALELSLRQTAALRLNNPEVSLKELGELLTPNVGKSGVSHRLNKIGKIAEQLRSDKSKC